MSNSHGVTFAPEVEEDAEQVRLEHASSVDQAEDVDDFDNEGEDDSEDDSEGDIAELMDRVNDMDWEEGAGGEGIH
jgi:hypothetical protein